MLSLDSTRAGVPPADMGDRETSTPLDLGDGCLVVVDLVEGSAFCPVEEELYCFVIGEDD